MPAAPDSPFAIYERALAAGEGVLRIDPAQSLVKIIVRRGGTFARLGHDHVVAARQLEGYAAPARGTAALRFRLDEMSVDEAALRAQAGLTTVPTADAIAGTRQNMLNRVLEAEHFPYLLLHATQLPDGRLRADITLHGVTHSYTVDSVRKEESGTLRVAGAFTAKQSDFGITPFAVLGGALAVKDELELSFEISARR